MRAATARSLRLPVPRHPLRLGDKLQFPASSWRRKNRDLLACHIAKVCVWCARRGQVDPHVGEHIVLRYAFALIIYPSERQFRFRIPLVGGFSEPSQTLRRVLGHTESPCVHRSKFSLPVGIPLIGGLAVPFDGFLVVLRHSSEQP